MDIKNVAPYVPRAACGPRMGLTALLLLGGCADTTVNQQPAATADKSCHTISTISTSQDAAKDRKKQEDRVASLADFIDTLAMLQASIQNTQAKIRAQQKPMSEMNMGWAAYDLLNTLSSTNTHLAQHMGDDVQGYLRNIFGKDPDRAIQDLNQTLPATNNLKATVIAILGLLRHATDSEIPSAERLTKQPLYLTDIAIKLESVIADLTAEQTTLLAEMKRREIDRCVAGQIAAVHN